MRVPKYRPHKTGQARCQWQGATIYFGKYGTPESREKYKRFVHSITDKQPVSLPVGQSISIGMLCGHYLRHAKVYYSASQFDHMSRAVRWLVDACGHTNVNAFGPAKLKDFREQVIAARAKKRGPRSRGYINDQITRVRRIFRWGVESELVQSNVLAALEAVPNLKANRTTAPEMPEVEPVPQEIIDAVLPHLSPTVATMLRLQRLTGMRPGSLCAMQVGHIDMSENPWVYSPPQHKNTWRGQELDIQLGPQAQRLIVPYLKGEYLFSPARATEERNALRRAKRKTRVQPSQVYRKKEFPKRTPGKKYTSRSYRRAIVYAIAQARLDQPHLEHFHPHQVRHTVGTELRKKYKLEGAKVALGHKHINATQLYAEADMELAKRIALEAG